MTDLLGERARLTPIPGWPSSSPKLEVTASWQPARRTPEELHCLLYTSGTTGRPKGVMIPHRQVIWNGYNTVVGWQLRADDVSPVFTPLYHAGGLAAFLVPIFTIGGTVVLHRGFAMNRAPTTENRAASPGNL